jgi:hypothetical protein
LPAFGKKLATRENDRWVSVSNVLLVLPIRDALRVRCYRRVGEVDAVCKPLLTAQEEFEE